VRARVRAKRYRQNVHHDGYGRRTGARAQNLCCSRAVTDRDHSQVRFLINNTYIPLMLDPPPTEDILPKLLNYEEY
jgi:hypothetical protein